MQKAIMQKSNRLSVEITTENTVAKELTNANK